MLLHGRRRLLPRPRTPADRRRPRPRRRTRAARRLAFVVDTFREGCLGESVAAAIAGLAAAPCDDPTLRALLERIAEDELRHAALAWRAVRWALAQPDAQPLRAALPDLLTPTFAATDDHDELPALGLLSSREETLLAANLWREVLAPCRDALLVPQ